jgi:hypothetical protein
MFGISPPILAAPAALGIAFVCCGCGRTVLRWLRAEPESTVSEIAFSTGLGLGILAYLVLALGLLGILSSVSIAVTLAALAILGLASLTSGRHREPHTANAGPEPREPWRPIEVCLLVVLVGGGLLTLIGVVAPPVADDWDGLAYHLADPKLYLEHGRIYPIWFESHSNFPFTVEMLYTVGLALKSVSLAKAFSWILWEIGAAGVYGLTRTLAREASSRCAGLVAAVAFAATPIILWEATSSYIDVAACAFLVLSIHALLLWRRSDVWGWLVASGVFSGWALGTKMTLAVPVALLIACSLWWCKGPGRRRVACALALTGVALAVASPWYIKSYAWTGNPVYPFYYSIFDGKNWSAENEAAYKAQQSGFGIKDRGPLQFVRTPWEASIAPQVYYDKVSSNPWVIYLFSLGIVFLVSLPILGAGLRWERETFGLLAILALSFAAWFAQVQYLRYLVPLVGLAAALVGASAARLSGRGQAVRATLSLFAWFVVAMSLLHVGLIARFVSLDRLSVVMGRQSQSDYLESHLAMFPMVEFINRELPPDAKVIMYHEVFGLYLDRAYMWGNPQHHTLIPYDTFKTVDELLRGLRKEDVTHVLVNERFMPDYESAEPWVRLLYEGIWDGCIVPIYSERGYTLFELAGS